MKKVLTIVLAVALCLAAGFWILIRTNENFAVWLGLSSGPGKPVELKSGSYFLESDEETIMVPYLYLDLEKNIAHLSGGIAMSYAENGTVTVDGTSLLVETQPTTYVFRVQDEDTLILTDCTGENPFQLPIGGELVYNEEWS